MRSKPLYKKTSARWSNQWRKILLAVDLFSWCLALNEIPLNVSGEQDLQNELPLIYNSVA